MLEKYLKFKECLHKSIIHDLNLLLLKYESENIYALALTTDSEFTTIRLALATVSFLNSCASDNIFNSLQEFSGIAWSPEEWTIFSDELPDSKLTSLQYEIDGIYRKVTDFEDYQVEMEKAFIDAVRILNFDKNLEGTIYKFVYDTDPNDEEYLPNKSSKILNSRKLHENFIARYTKFFDFYPTVKIKSKKRLLP